MSADAVASIFEGSQQPFTVFALVLPDAGNINIVSATTNAAGPFHTLDINTSPRMRSQRSSQSDGLNAAQFSSQLATFANGPNCMLFIYDGSQIRTAQDDYLDQFVAHDRSPLSGLTRFNLGLLRRNTSSLPANGLFRSLAITREVFGQAEAEALFRWAMPNIGFVWHFGSSLVVGTGSNGQAGWRRPLYGMYRASGLYPRFTGTLVDGTATFSQRRHDGYSGISLASMIALAPSLVAGLPNQPRLLNLLAGQGDMTGYSTPGTITSYYQLLELLHLLLPPDCAICVTTLTPWDPATNPVEAANTNSFNGELPGAWSAFMAAHPTRVLLFADLNTAIGGPGFVAANFADHVHPNNGGYDLCASEWYAATVPLVQTWTPIAA